MKLKIDELSVQKMNLQNKSNGLEERVEIFREKVKEVGKYLKKVKGDRNQVQA